MTHDTFNRLVEERIGKIRSILLAKAKEYASDADRLHNFKADAGGVEMSERPAEVLWGYLRKHLQAIYDMTGMIVSPSQAQVNEKVGDAINYLILLEALLKE